MDRSSLAKDAAAQAAELVGRRPSDLSIKSKSRPDDLVTNKDIEVQSFLETKLRASGDPVMGEEGFGGRLPDRPFWCLDPIDGTINFAHGLPFYGVSIGFVDGRSFPTGALNFPALGEHYYCDQAGHGYLNGQQLRTDDCDLTEALTGISLTGDKNNEGLVAREFDLFRLAHVGTRGCLRTGSAALTLCYVASGRLQASFGLQTRIWDIAGACAICSAAGCKILINWHEDPTYADYIVGVPRVVDQLYELLRPF